VLAPLRGSFTSFACLTDRRGWHILCRPAFRPRPAGSPGRLILFSAADCLLLIATSLLLSFWCVLLKRARESRPERLCC
ncbi:hypothetical protein EYB39_18820, partial [Pantoea agglomerans]